MVNDARSLTITIVPALYRFDSKGRLMPEQGSLGKDGARCCQKDLSGGGVCITVSRMGLETLPD